MKFFNLPLLFKILCLFLSYLFYIYFFILIFQKIIFSKIELKVFNFIHNFFFLSAHQSNVRSVLFALDYNWLLSCGNDKYFQWHCTKTGKRLGGYASNSRCSCLQYLLQHSYLNAIIDIK